MTKFVGVRAKTLYKFLYKFIYIIKIHTKQNINF